MSTNVLYCSNLAALGRNELSSLFFGDLGYFTKLQNCNKKKEKSPKITKIHKKAKIEISKIMQKSVKKQKQNFQFRYENKRFFSETFRSHFQTVCGPVIFAFQHDVIPNGRPRLWTWQTFCHNAYKQKALWTCGHFSSV